MTVYKYTVPAEDRPVVRTHKGAELLCVAEQFGALCLWVRVDPSQPETMRGLRVAGTGHPDADGVYVGTALLAGGSLVLHVFDLGEVVAA